MTDDLRQAASHLLDHLREGRDGPLPFADATDPVLRELRGVLGGLGRVRVAHDQWTVAADACARGEYIAFHTVETGDPAIDAIGFGLNGMVEEIRATTSALAQARDTALAASTAKSTFLANMSHELRTPLNAIIGYGELLFEDATEPGTQSDLERILRAARSLLALISDVLDLSKIEAGRIELALETFAVEPLCRELVDTIVPQAVLRGNVIELTLDPAIGSQHGDVVRIRQILLNLLSNGNKFTRDGTVRMHVRPGILRGGPAIEFVVTDTGIGIAPERQDAVFEPFTQADPEVYRQFGGTGLGLAIASRFVRLMNGELTLDSAIGRGSTFTVRLPAVATRAERLPTPAPTSGRPLLLLVDDDPEVHDLVSRHLAREHCLVMSAYTGGEALALARTYRPAVIVLDVLMPGMGGWDVLAALKQDPVTRDIPVVMQSMVDDRSRGVLLGASEYLFKPVNRDALLRVLDPMIETDGSVVLVVDDDESTRDVVSRTLSAHGWQVQLAADGQQALASLGRSRPDVLLLDLMMPNVDGFAVIEHVRSTPRLADLPIVVYSAKALTDPEKAALDAGVQDVLQKGSVSRTELLRQLGSLIRKATPA
ncbi:MAG: response regulator [Myxococcota bacterium]